MPFTINNYFCDHDGHIIVGKSCLKNLSLQRLQWKGMLLQTVFRMLIQTVLRMVETGGCVWQKEKFVLKSFSMCYSNSSELSKVHYFFWVVLCLSVKPVTWKILIFLTILGDPGSDNYNNWERMTISQATSGRLLTFAHTPWNLCLVFFLTGTSFVRENWC